MAPLAAHGVEGLNDHAREIFVALELLTRHPLIGRPVAGAVRQPVMGEGSRGHVARYRCDPLQELLMVMGLRGRREAGFADR